MDEQLFYQRELEKNLAALEQRHDQLSRRMNSLRSRKDIIRLRARSLDYYGKKERVIRISGWKKHEYQPYSPGKIIRFQGRYQSRPAPFRAMAVVTGMAVYGLFLLLNRGGRAYSRRRQRADR